MINEYSEEFDDRFGVWMDKILWITIVLIPLVVLFPLGILPLKIHDIFDTAKGPILVLSGLSLLIILFLKKKWDQSKIVLLLSAYLFLVLLSSIFAADPLLALVGATPNGGRFEGFITIFIYGILFYCAKNYLIITHKKIIWSFSFLSIASIYALVQYYQVDPMVIYRNYRPMVFSTIGNQNFLGSLMVMLAVAALVLSIYFKKWYYYLFLGLFYSTLLVAQTRSTWIAFGCVLFLLTILVLISGKAYWLSYVLSVILLVLVSITLNYSKKNVLSARSKTIKTEITKKDDFGGSGRLKIWEICWKVLKDHPLLGTGPENLKKVLHKEYKKEINEYYRVKGTSVDKAHNEFLHIAVVTGIPAILVYLSMLILIFKDNMKHLFKRNEKTVLFLIVLAYLIQAFFNISVIAVAPLYWIILGRLSRNISTKEVY